MRARTLLTVLVSCCGLFSYRPLLGDSPQSAPPLERITRVFDTAEGSEIPLAALGQRLHGRDAVFLGETHLDETTHRLEAYLLADLLERTHGKLVLAMEMFERDVQPVLDDYLSGRISEQEFLEASRPWRNYRTGYRALIELAKAHGIPVVASNLPRPLRRKLAMQGEPGMDLLSPQERAWLPPEIHPNSDGYWRRFERVVRGHGSVQGRFIQQLWDNCMGAACAEALKKHPGFCVLHVNGGFHSSHQQGTVEQFRLRAPQASVATVSIIPVSDLEAIDPASSSGSADFLIYAQSRARGISQGTHAVSVSSELRYRLRVPDGTQEPLPLLIWLGEDSTRPEDEMAFWKMALGDEAVVAIVEPPYPQLHEDLHLGGRWFWDEYFFENLELLGAGIEKLYGYLLRHYPIRRDLLVVAGSGTGGTVVAAVALHTISFPLQAIAIDPQRFARLREGALPSPPDPELVQPELRYRKLTVMVPESGVAWWQQEAIDMRSTGLLVTVEKLPEMASATRLGENAVRSALRLPAHTLKSDGAHTVLVLHEDSPLARRWAELEARSREQRGGRVSLVPVSELPSLLARAGSPSLPSFHSLSFQAGPGAGWSIAKLAEGSVLPVVPGPFAGTTVLVVPAGVSEEERSAWLALEDSKAIQKRSRFAQLRVAFWEGGPSLADVLRELRAQGQTKLLVAPAVYCAGAADMRRLRQQVQEFFDDFSLYWLPGLGGRLHLLE